MGEARAGKVTSKYRVTIPKAIANRYGIRPGDQVRWLAAGDVIVPHQAILEFLAAVTRPSRGHVILKQPDALREAEELLKQFTVLYPNEAIVREAVRGCAAYELSWFDAHLWAYAEHYGLAEILTEDFQHDRLYGSVRVVNPFLDVESVWPISPPGGNTLTEAGSGTDCAECGCG